MRRITEKLRTLCFGVSLLACAVLPAPVASADDAAMPPGPRHSRRGPPPLEKILERHADRLGLDEATREQIRTIVEAGRPRSIQLQQRLDELRDEMRGLLGEDVPDEDAVMRQAERIGAVEIGAQKHRLRTMLEIRALLTPAQREELVAIHQERRGRRGGPRGWRGEPPPLGYGPTDPR